MRRFPIILLAIALASSVAQSQYFPKLALGNSHGGDRLKQEWYSSQLTALGEPSLFALVNTPPTQCYRFLWLRTFNHPVAVRLEVKPDGSGLLTTKVANGAGGFRPGALSKNTSQIVSIAQTQAFLTRLDKLDFWRAPNPVNDQAGTDGSQWIIEGVKAGKYHVIDRWSPTTGIARELGMMLAFDLAQMKVPKNEIY